MNMNKSLIALAVAGVCATSAAMAEVSIYGQANVSYDVIDNDKGARDSQGVNSNGSRFGLKGSETLGSGLSAIWQIESQVAIGAGAGGTQNDRSSTAVAQRDTFAGLKSDIAGTVRLGRFDTPYKLATRSMDVFHNTIADNRSLMGIGHDVRTSNTVGFNSLDYNGFSVSGSYFGDQGGTSEPGPNFNTFSNPKNRGNSYDYTNEGVSVAGMYKAGPIDAIAAYQTQSNEIGDGVFGTGAPNRAINSSAWKVGGSYTTDLFALSGVYESMRNGGGGGGASAYYLSGKYNMTSEDTLKLAFADLSGTTDKANKSGATQYSLGYDHKMTNHTTLYALYTSLNNDKSAAYQLGGNSASSSTSASALGRDPTAFSVGMKHSF